MLCRRVCDVFLPARIPSGALIRCPLIYRAFKQSISWVKPPSGGLGPNTRRPPGRFCRALRFPAFPSFPDWDTCAAYTGKYPIPLWRPLLNKPCRSVYVILRNPPEKIVRMSGEKIVTHYS